jgi:hypothetical protein
MNTDKASALLHYMGQIRRRIGRELQPATRFVRHGQTRTDKPSGAQRRFQTRWGGRYRYDATAKVWRLQAPQASFLARFRTINGTSELPRTPRGRLSNPTVLR